MGKTYVKTIIREIRQSFGRFVAIFAIVALGVGFLAGLLVATPNMKLSVDQYYEDHNMTDIFIKSKLGLTKDDLKEVSKIKEVEHIMPAYVTDKLMVTNNSDLFTTRIYGLPLGNLNTKDSQFINRLELIEGRMPTSNNECVVERSGSYISEIEIGTTLTIIGDEDLGEELEYTYNNTQFKVVGIVSNPFYFSMEREPSSEGDGRLGAIIYVNEESYNLDVYTDFYIRLLGSGALPSFTDEYENFTKEIAKKIEKVGQDRSNIPYKHVMEEAKWYVLDRNSNISYASFSANVEKVGAIAKVFPIFFLLVAALVALTTMTRMVEEGRTQIGTLKALGYTNAAIMSKYIIYCGIASLLGSVLGLATGFKILPTVIWSAYKNMYRLPVLITDFSWGLAIIASILAITSTMVATISAANKALKEKPATLMLPRAPKAGKRIFLEKVTFIWSRMKFTYKATARNLIRYKKHFFMTVIGISGCTALIVAGFGLRNSIGDIANTQFEQILKYDLKIQTDKGNKRDEILDDFLSNTDKVQDHMALFSQDGKVYGQDDAFDTTIMVPKDSQKLRKFINIRQRKNNEPITFNDSSVVMTEKLAESLNIKIGETFTLENAEDQKAQFILTGITENYVGSYAYINRADYVKAFGQDLAYDTLIVKTLINSATEQDATLVQVLSADTALGAEFMSQTKETYDNLLESINFIVIVLILAAGGLAIIVLYNLTNINIDERRTELATLKVLGFHNKEVAAYIYRETSILTMTGAGVGLVLGTVLHKFIVKIGESVDLMFGRDIAFSSYVISVIITLLFSAVVDVIMYQKLKSIEMVDSMKAMD